MVHYSSYAGNLHKIELTLYTDQKNFKIVCTLTRTKKHE